MQEGATIGQLTVCILQVGESTDDIMALTTPPELTTPPSDDMSSDGVLSDGEISPQLCDLTSLPEESYSTLTVHCDHSGTFGFSVRHFTIQSDSSQVSCRLLSVTMS